MASSDSCAFLTGSKRNRANTVRRARPWAWHTFAGGTCLLLSLGCASDGLPPAPPVVRDSAGVRIIENSLPQWLPGSEWKLSSRPIVRIEANDDELETGPVDPAAAFILRTGEIIVLDGMFSGWDRGLVFDSAGTFVRHLGRSGNGPCEFRQVFGGGRYRRDSIAVHDFAARSITIMSAGGECARTISIPITQPVTRNPQWSHTFLGVYNDGGFLISPYGVADVKDGEATAWYVHRVITLRADGSATEKPGGDIALSRTGISPGKRSPQSVPRLHGERRFVAPYDSGLVVGENTRFDLHVLDASGSVRLIARRPHEPVRLSDTDKRDAVMHLRSTTVSTERSYTPPRTVEQEVARMSWPEFKPAYSNLRVDELGNFWLEEYRFYHPLEVPDNPPPTYWSVFDHNGVWLGQVQVPGRLLVHDIYDDRLIGVWKNDVGAGSVRVYRINKPE